MIFKISYFYNVRHLRPNQVPISTAMYDPKWFHNNKGQGHMFVDKNGVVNGARIQDLVPGENCNDTCRGKQYCSTTPDICLFLRRYEDQLAGLDFDKVVETLTSMVENYTRRNPRYGCGELECILMVYETPDNPCSERGPLVKWFKDHGVDLVEFER